MTVSTSTTFLMSKNELIREAFDVIGVGSQGEAISADMYRRASNSLNLMIQSWNAMENLWRRAQETITLVSGQAAYTLDDPKPMRVDTGRRVSASGYETPMTAWARQEYLDQPNKTQSLSTPVNFYYDVQRDEGILYVWPAPSTQVAASTTLKMDTLRPFFIMDTTADTLDYPQEWQEAVVMNLAKRLKLKYPVNDPNLAADVDTAADTLFAQLKAWDNEPVSIYLQPERRWDGR